MSEEATKNQIEEQPENTEEQKDLSGILKDQNNAPTEEQIEQWKIKYGEVYVSGFSETELFVWRPILRPEYRNLQERAQDSSSQFDQLMLEEAVCDTCLVWRSVNKPWDQMKAGIPQTISEQIMNNSGFLSPSASSMLVAKL